MGDVVLDVRGLTKRYAAGRGEVLALDGVALSARAGEIVGLLGPNGAGKTTTIKSICGLVTPTAGTIEIAGIDARRRPRAAARQVAAVLEGNRTVYWRLTVRENLEYFASLRGLKRRAVTSKIDELVERFTLGDKTDTPAMRLSRGMQQKLAVACAVLPGTPLLLLDEPTLGLDVETSYQLRASLRELAAEEQRTILLSSHDMHVVRDVCERVVVITGGRVVADDTIAGLLGLLDARAYRVTTPTEVSPAMEEAIVGRFAAAIVERRGPTTSIAVSLSAGDDFYAFVDLLRANGVAVDTIEGAQPDLEQVFLSIVSKDRVQ